MEKIQEEIDSIKERNKRVESDKAWETSITRKFLIAILTYFVVVLFFYMAKVNKPWVNAIVPTLGFMISTLSLSFFKKMWIKRKEKYVHSIIGSSDKTNDKDGAKGGCHRRGRAMNKQKE